MKRLVVLPRALESLEGIIEWSERTFGHMRTVKYRNDLLAAARSVAQGAALTRSCRTMFAPDLVRDLRFVRSGSHVIILIETPTTVAVLDILHQSSDLAARLRDLPSLD